MTASSDMSLIPLCDAAAVPPGGSLKVEVDGLPPLAVFLLDDGYYVCDDTCSHGQASLSEGSIDGTTIECPWHSGSFCLRTGAALAFPAVIPIRVYPATLNDGKVCVTAAGDS